MELEKARPCSTSDSTPALNTETATTQINIAPDRQTTPVISSAARDLLLIVPVGILLLRLGGFRCFHSFGGLRVLLLKTFDAPRSVHQLLLAGEKRMAIRTDFHAHHRAFESRARLKRMAAGAVNFNFVIIGVNSSFHVFAPIRQPVCTASAPGMNN